MKRASPTMLRRALSLSARFCSDHVCNSIIRRGRLAVLSQRWNAASAAHSGRPAKQSGLQADMLSMGSKSTFDDNDAELVADERAKGGTASARKEKLQQAAEDLVEETDATTDPGIIFETAFSSIEQKIGRENMVFPKEIIFLCGAPGAGKGTMADAIMTERTLSEGPIEVSNLLSSPEFKAIKDSGQLVSDRHVVEAVLLELLKPKYRAGTIVDGFPRTRVQAGIIKKLHQRMMDLRIEFREHPTLKNAFRRPIFRITVLYVEEEESVKRQVARAYRLAASNRMAADTGLGKVVQARATDLSEDLARERYRVFKREVYDAVQSLTNERFQFHLVNAMGEPEEVRQRVMNEFSYQSSLELGDQTFEVIKALLPAQGVVKNARQNMVQRLNSYARDHPKLLVEVTEMLKSDFEHIFMRQALSGRAIVRSNSSLLSSSLGLNMALDILTERGYRVTLDVHQEVVPIRIEPGVPGDPSGQKVHVDTRKSFIFTVDFDRPVMRRILG